MSGREGRRSAARPAEPARAGRRDRVGCCGPRQSRSTRLPRARWQRLSAGRSRTEDTAAPTRDHPSVGPRRGNVSRRLGTRSWRPGSEEGGRSGAASGDAVGERPNPRHRVFPVPGDASVATGRNAPCAVWSGSTKTGRVPKIGPKDLHRLNGGCAAVVSFYEQSPSNDHVLVGALRSFLEDGRFTPQHASRPGGFCLPTSTSAPREHGEHHEGSRQPETPRHRDMFAWASVRECRLRRSSFGATDLPRLSVKSRFSSFGGRVVLGAGCRAETTRQRGVAGVADRDPRRRESSRPRHAGREVED